MRDPRSEDAFERSLRAALGRGRAPRVWVEEALAQAARVGPLPAPVAPRREASLVGVLLPHLLGLLLLGGFLAALLLRPDRGAPLAETLAGLVRGLALPHPGITLLPALLGTALLALALVLVLGLAAGGFARAGRR